jgi:acyl-coenzyme A thioesterase PaaI-like protein
MLRPGGTMSGPAMMFLADIAVYIALLGEIGWKPLAVTNQLNIHFLRKPPPGDLVADCRLLKVGKRLAMGDVSIRGADAQDIVAHATVSYSVPA